MSNLYHATTADAALEILKSGYLLTKAELVHFGVDKIDGTDRRPIIDACAPLTPDFPSRHSTHAMEKCGRFQVEFAIEKIKCRFPSQFF